jgi:hypothetical protein
VRAIAKNRRTASAVGMQLAILAFIFGVLLLLMSAAALALEAVSNAAGIGHLALLLLAALHAAAGFFAIGGARAYAVGCWREVAMALAAGMSATAGATVVAFYLATQVKLGLSPDAAISIVMVALTAGSISTAMVVLQARKATP